MREDNSCTNRYGTLVNRFVSEAFYDAIGRPLDTIGEQCTLSNLNHIIEHVLLDTFLTYGMEPDGEPNALGLQIEAYIDRFNGLRFELQNQGSKT